MQNYKSFHFQFLKIPTPGRNSTIIFLSVCLILRLQSPYLPEMFAFVKRHSPPNSGVQCNSLPSILQSSSVWRNDGNRKRYTTSAYRRLGVQRLGSLRWTTFQTFQRSNANVTPDRAVDISNLLLFSIIYCYPEVGELDLWCQIASVYGPARPGIWRWMALYEGKLFKRSINCIHQPWSDNVFQTTRFWSCKMNVVYCVNCYFLTKLFSK